MTTALIDKHTSLERMQTLVSAPNAEDYFEAPLAEIENFDKKVSKHQAARRNIANKYPRTELDRMQEQLEKYNLKKKRPVVDTPSVNLPPPNSAPQSHKNSP
jgi:hypothetical protein